MLPEEVKKSIQSAYKELIANYSFTSRYGQRQMIATIANSLAKIDADNSDADAAPICVVEAGTGTGKTLAYILGTLPVAKKLDLKVVLSTATVALQEQVVLKDLPDVLQGSKLDFTFAMAKGRGRYLCLAKLDSLLQGNDSLNAMLDLYGDDVLPDLGESHDLYQSMLDEINKGLWQGDRDEWSEPLSDRQWRPVTVENSQCVGAKCSHFRHCFYFKARESMDDADCVVANHDLVLSDLALGGGVILPSPEGTIYIIDEAHHLPQKSTNHFAANARLKGGIAWLQQTAKMVSQISQQQELFAALPEGLESETLQQLLSELEQKLQQAWLLFSQFFDEGVELNNYGNSSQYTFSQGAVPPEVQQLASSLTALFLRLTDKLSELQQQVKAVLENGGGIEARSSAESWFPLVGLLTNRADSQLKLWSSFASGDQQSGPPSARWLSLTDSAGNADISLASSPVLAAENLSTRLWEKCAAAVLTSATLSALGNFNVLKMRAGLPESTEYLSIPSPFDFERNAVLCIPRMRCVPTEVDKHTQAIIDNLPGLIDPGQAALMLFASRRQMQDVLEGLPEDFRQRVLCQDDFQKTQLLKYHRQQVDKGLGSVIFGLASFAEGVDLPGKYCTHVLIAKIPFSVPNDPVESTLSEWIEMQGQNAFMSLAVPEAAFRLVQACGRLLRNETDTGRITIFDERLVKKQYGKTILASLPPYNREIYQVDLLTDLA